MVFARQRAGRHDRATELRERLGGDRNSSLASGRALAVGEDGGATAIAQRHQRVRIATAQSVWRDVG